MIAGAALALKEAEHRVKIGLQIAYAANGIVDDFLVSFVCGVVELTHAIAGEIILVLRDTLKNISVILGDFVGLLSEFQGADVRINHLKLTHFFAVILICFFRKSLKLIHMLPSFLFLKLIKY